MQYAAFLILLVFGAAPAGAQDRTLASPKLESAPTSAGGARTTLAVADRANEHVSLAASGAFVVAAWAAALPAGGSDIFTAISRDSGTTFAPPVRVNAHAGEAKTNGEQPPRVGLVPQSSGAPAVVVVWTASGERGTRIVSSRSTDGGRTFSTPVPVAGTEAPGNRGWESLAVDGRGRAWALWLDHRKTVPNASAGEHHHEPRKTPADSAASVARAQLSELYVSALDNSVPARSLVGGVCYCCKTALTAGPDGSLYAAWRHVYPGNHRDIAFTVSRDGGGTFSDAARVSDDSWEINGCPENGPAIAADARGAAHVVWPTLVKTGPEPALALFWAMTRDGRTFTKRQQIPTDGQPFHPQVVVTGDGALLVAWDEVVNGSRRVAIARGVVAPDGRSTFETLRTVGVVPGSYPALAIAGDGPVLAWTNRAGPKPVVEVMRITATDSGKK
jgi:hypothetical protein